MICCRLFILLIAADFRRIRHRKLIHNSTPLDSNDINRSIRMWGDPSWARRSVNHTASAYSGEDGDFNELIWLFEIEFEKFDLKTIAQTKSRTKICLIRGGLNNSNNRCFDCSNRRTIAVWIFSKINWFLMNAARSDDSAVIEAHRLEWSLTDHSVSSPSGRTTESEF